MHIHGISTFKEHRTCAREDAYTRFPVNIAIPIQRRFARYCWCGLASSCSCYFTTNHAGVNRLQTGSYDTPTSVLELWVCSAHFCFRLHCNYPLRQDLVQKAHLRSHSRHYHLISAHSLQSQTVHSYYYDTVTWTWWCTGGTSVGDYSAAGNVRQGHHQDQNNTSTSPESGPTSLVFFLHSNREICICGSPGRVGLGQHVRKLTAKNSFLLARLTKSAHPRRLQTYSTYGLITTWDFSLSRRQVWRWLCSWMSRHVVC
jgi:hypothetical protein